METGGKGVVGGGGKGGGRERVGRGENEIYIHQNRFFFYRARCFVAVFFVCRHTPELMRF